MQAPVWPLTAQTLMHGVESGGGDMGLALAKRLKFRAQIGPETIRIEFR